MHYRNFSTSRVRVFMKIIQDVSQRVLVHPAALWLPLLFTAVCALKARARSGSVLNRFTRSHVTEKKKKETARSEGEVFNGSSS